MKISLEILESEKEISRRIGQALLPEVTNYLKNRIKIIRTELPSIVNKYIVDSPEYTSLLRGKLRYEFGIPDAQSKLAGLLDIWSKNIDITYTPPKIIGSGEIRAKFSISMIKIDFSDVLYSEYASSMNVLAGYSLPWLQWLLLDGNTVLVSGYQLIVGPNVRSRTGFAIMRASPTGSWKVPSEFAGTINDNWITRSLGRASEEINKFLQKVLEL